jgi:hypothetical protein
MSGGYRSHGKVRHVTRAAESSLALQRLLSPTEERGGDESVQEVELQSVHGAMTRQTCVKITSQHCASGSARRNAAGNRKLC